MWFNSMIREEPYLLLTYLEPFRDERVLLNQDTGAAWLSSARVVRCWVKSRNERNPYHYLPARYGGNFNETAGDKPEEGGGRRQVIMALMGRATHVLQWLIQWAANPRGGANPIKLVSVRIEVCNSTS
ncbi:MAG: hypothetical protein CM1200mP17_08440 [Woeseia sp.]|nr:MAG: hypothetical protein CM1200mP17_08440 [Woeseia sp.]